MEHKEKSIEKLKEEKKEIIKEIVQKERKEKRDNNIEKGNKILRVSNSFNSELESIQLDRVEKNMEEYPISKPKITDLIIKHKNWGQIKEDCKNFIFQKNKKAQTTMAIFFGIFLVFFVIIYFFIFGTTMLHVNTALSQNLSLGQVNLAEINAQTFGVFAISIMNNADWWGLGTIFGMVLGLLMSAYFLRGRFPKFGLILAIFLIIAIFIFALYMRSTYLNLME